MLSLDELVKNLARSEVTEIALMTGRLPCVKVDGQYKPVDETARSADAILKILAKLGGARYLDDLGEKAVQWTTRVDGVGTIAVSAIDRAGNIDISPIARHFAVAVTPPPPANTACDKAKAKLAKAKAKLKKAKKSGSKAKVKKAKAKVKKAKAKVKKAC